MPHSLSTSVPRHREAAYGGEVILLENRHLRVEVYRRTGGWGWAEIYGPEIDGTRTFLAVLEHFGEIDVPAYAHPMHLEAQTYERTEKEGRVTLRFPLSMQIPEEPCMAWDNISPVEGALILSLGPESKGLDYRLEVARKFRVWCRSLRGPWVRVGAYASGVRREDAIFPGIDWVINEEWSSGNDFHGPGLQDRFVPHPEKVTLPRMTVSHSGCAVWLSWRPNQIAPTTMGRSRQVQPVFASPNFVDRRSEHLMGLMLPSVESGLPENTLVSQEGLDLPKGSPLVLSACIGVTPGRSLDALVDWVKEHGMPEPPPLRWPERDAVEKIATALDNNLWTEGKGFTYGSNRPRSWIIAKLWGKDWLRQPHMYLRFIEDFCRHYPDSPSTPGLLKKAEWCRAQGTFVERPGTYEMLRWYDNQKLGELAGLILSSQQPDGNFPYNPDSQAGHFAQHAKFCDRWKPLGLPGDTVFEMCVAPAVLLFLLGRELGRTDCAEAALRTLDFAWPMTRPVGGDWWECPLQAPNLLSAAHGVMAYWLGWKATGRELYLLRARHFLRSFLVFTYLWEPENKHLLYETSPLFGTTGWHYMAWNDRNVQWQILLASDFCHQIGCDWAEIDPELDWRRFRRGIAEAGLRWLVDHTDRHWMFRCESPTEAIRHGQFDMVLADVHDPVSDCFGGINLALEPSWVGSLLLAERQGGEAR